MRKKAGSIPVNMMDDHLGGGIAIERLIIEDLSAIQEDNPAHRHNGHSFFLLEHGTVHIEVDFQKYTIVAPSVIYVHPNQVHYTLAPENITVSSWWLADENINPDYLKLLEDLTPAKPLPLDAETFNLISQAVNLAINFNQRKNDKLYHPLLKDSCNALVALVASLYLASAPPTDKLSRFDIVTKAFRELLERNYKTTDKRPAAYARQLNISTPYLNECVKNATGYSVSHHIRQRVILEAKRLLYHSNQSVKEISAALGYDDYPYFSRLFTKVTGISALAFRNKNHD